MCKHTELRCVKFQAVISGQQMSFTSALHWEQNPCLIVCLKKKARCCCIDTRVCIHVCNLVFLLAEHSDTYTPHSISGMFSLSFSLRAHVYLCLIKQAPHFLMPDPRQEGCWHETQAWPRRGGLLYTAIWSTFEEVFYHWRWHFL